MKNLALPCFFVFITVNALSQSSSTLIGSRANGLGYASTCLTDEWALFNNVAGLAKIEQVTTGFTYEARPAFESFNRRALAIALPLKFGVAGLGAFKFGDDLYNEQIVSAGFSNKFGLASLGLKVNYVQYNAEGFGRKDAVTISFGGIASLTPNLLVGAHIINLNQPKISTTDNERVPTTLALGVAYSPSDKLFVSTEIEKDIDYDARLKAGLEYTIHKKFVWRSGFNFSPNMAFVGVGFRPSKFNIDYAYSYQFNLGARHQTSVSINF